MILKKTVEKRKKKKDQICFFIEILATKPICPPQLTPVD